MKFQFWLRSLVLIGWLAFNFSGARAAVDVDAAKWVDPFIGTQGAGATYPGAQAPFGMISTGPASSYRDYGGWEARAGYQYEATRLVGFALTHVSGAGLHAAQDLPFVPYVGDLSVSPVGANRDLYGSAFTNSRQKAAPGFYRVELETHRTTVSIASRARSSVVQLDYPATAKANLLFVPPNNGTAISDSSLTIAPNAREISGFAASGDFADAPFNTDKFPYRIYFVAKFDRPLASWGTWRNADKIVGATRAQGTAAAAYLRFDCTRRRRVNMRLAISYVSVENARLNLQREIPLPDLEAVRAATRADWNALLGRVRVTGGSDSKIRSFYTALYHNALQPSVFDDTNGQYIGFDKQLHQIAAGHHFYVTFSLWDTYRTTAQLQALLAPKIASDMVQSLLLSSVQAAGGGLPTWSLLNNDTGVMGTYSANPFIANMYAFGARDFDLKLARERMVMTAMKEMRNGKDGAAWWGLSDYIKLGYRPGSASETLEYGIADFSIAQIARAAGDEENYRYFLRRSGNSFGIFNPATGFMQPRAADGSWIGPFAPGMEKGFTEGNAAQYTWMTPHNVARLIELMGGIEATRARLDEFFDPILIEGWNTGQPHYWLGNEPTMGVPYLYNWVGEPWKAQRITRQVIDNYRDVPGGYVGNDDLGTMSALYVFACLGLYPAIPGVGGFTLTAPLFESVEIDVPTGKTLHIRAQGAAQNAAYIQSLKLNGRAYRRTWLALEQLKKGRNELDFAVSSTPNLGWGAAPQDAPPSFAGAQAGALSDRAGE